MTPADATAWAILIGSIAGLLTAVGVFVTSILAILTFVRQGRRDTMMQGVQASVNGLLHETKAAALGQATAEAEAAHLRGEKEGMAAERAAPMSPAGT